MFHVLQKLHVVVELYGLTTAITITSTVKGILTSPGDSTPATGIAVSDSCHSIEDTTGQVSPGFRYVI